MEEKPSDFPRVRPDGSPLKPLTQVLLERRASARFTPEEVPEEYLEAILRFGTQAPSGYNLQPWRFVVVRDAENRQRLQRVAFNQQKIAEAPVVVIAFGMSEDWKRTAPEVFSEGAARGAGDPSKAERAAESAVGFVSKLIPEAWVNRQTMIALTTMMIVAEAYGFDTAPMEGFDAEGVRREFGLPEEAEVVALLAVGRAAPPDKP
ncbi:MAG TPA: nitroreductase family protein, partial [Pyrinomonadaceae bacterium]|nr:nitroreductase family protein [Pyrinomonadaceae bacterium]